MPGWSKVRVANVNFKRNSRRFDDLSLTPDTLNFLLDGENGDGKTLYAQCAVQSIIANSAFHPDNTIRKLYTENNNNVIHSMIEWELDRGNEYDYMITGFCAKDAQRESDENKRIFKYFNYVILYKKDFPFSIESIPLRTEKNGKVERMGYKSLQDFLRRIQLNDNRCAVEIFIDRKREYLNFLYDYSINEEEWNLLLKINKKEGGAEDYFVERYKHPKDFVIKEMIPIVEGVDRYRLGLDNTKEILAKSLLNISENVKNLLEKKQKLEDLVKIEKALLNIVNFNNDLLQAFKVKIETYKEIIKGYNKELVIIRTFEESIKELENRKETINKQYIELKEAIEKCEDEIKLEESNKEDLYDKLSDISDKERILLDRSNKNTLLSQINDLEKEKIIVQNSLNHLNDLNTNLKSDLEKAREQKKLKQAENIFLEYKDIYNSAQRKYNQLQLQHKTNEEIVKEKLKVEGMYCYSLNKTAKEIMGKITDVEYELKTVKENLDKNAEQITLDKSSLKNNSYKVSEITKSIAKAEKEITFLENEKEGLIDNNSKEVCKVKDLLKEILDIEAYYFKDEKFNTISRELKEIQELISKDIFSDLNLSLISSCKKSLENVNALILELDKKERESRRILEEDKTKELLENEISKKEEEIKSLILREKDLIKQEEKIKEDISTRKNDLDVANNELEQYKVSLSSINHILESYPKYNRIEIEQNLNADLGKLNEKLFSLNEKKNHIDSRLIDLHNNEGLTLAEETIECYEILLAKYPSAILGKDFIKALNAKDKEKYLSKTTLIAYGVILNSADYQNLYKNENLRNKLGDFLTPIFNMENFKNAKLIEENIYFFNTLNKDVFLNEEKLLQEIEKLEKAATKLEESIENIKEAINVKDTYFKNIYVFNQTYSLTYENSKNDEISKKYFKLLEKQNEQEEIKYRLSEIYLSKEKLNTNIQDIREEIKASEKNIKEQIDFVNFKLDELKSLSIKNNIRVNSFKGIEYCTLSIIKIRNDIAQNEERVSNLLLENLKSEHQIEDYGQEKLLLENSLNELERKNKEWNNNKALIEEEWSNLKVLEKEIRNKLLDLPKETISVENSTAVSELEIRIKNVLRRFEREASHILELEEEIRNATQNYERKRSEISTFNVDFNSLENRANSIFYNDAIVFSKIEDTIKNLGNCIVKNAEETKEAEKKFTEIEITIKNKKETADGINTRTDVLIPEGYDPLIERNVVNKLIEGIKEKIKGFKELQSGYRKKQDNTIVELQEIDGKINEISNKLSKAEILKSKTENLIENNNIPYDITDEIAENLIFINEKAVTELDLNNRRIRDLTAKHEREIRETSITLENSVFEFASVLADIHCPKNEVEIKNQNESITSEQGYIYYLKQEKDNLNRELEDLNSMKTEFIKKCVNSVELLISKLKNINKLSTVVINDKKVSLVELKLHELSSERKLEKMTYYIESLLEKINDLEQESSESKKQILSDLLSPGKMLEQGVRNLKSLEVDIYVPDSVNIENGYYEKWGGGASGGQRNMMYFTVVMALIIYIRELGSLKSASNNIKVIYADGPFRGAAAVYLWEPIFKLMKENNIQLIVTNYQTPKPLMHLFNSVALMVGTQVEINGNSIIENNLSMDSIFRRNDETLRSENLLYRFEEYKIPSRKTVVKVNKIDQYQTSLDVLLDDDE